MMFLAAAGIAVLLQASAQYFGFTYVNGFAAGILHFIYTRAKRYLLNETDTEFTIEEGFSCAHGCWLDYAT
ncbi:MAG: hypothetical protein HY074_07605 [Deltaproteobacteria bacterium]|nr:hypothetical protein [Deltaproteobacteria bacterium]